MDMKTAVMYGAGNIGRGFIAQLFCRSGYETVFIDVNTDLVNTLNTKREYPIFITENGEYRKETVSPVRAVNGRDGDAVAELIARADVMATAVGVPVLPALAKPIAAGIALRAKYKGAPLNILVCENKIEANLYLADLIKKELSPECVEYFEQNIGFVEPSIGRMVLAAPEKIRAKEPLAVCVEPFCELPVDLDSFCGEIPEIANMVPVSPFEVIIRRKLFMHNMSHAMTAYLGASIGKTYIWQAIADPRIRFGVLSALGESARGLSVAYQVPVSPLLAHGFELLHRYDNALLGDTVDRVGRDTERKLGAEDRIMGAIHLCKETDVPVKWLYIAAAAGYHFAPAEDLSSAAMKEFAAQKGIERALQVKSGLTDETAITEIARYYRAIAEMPGEEFLEWILK